MSLDISAFGPYRAIGVRYAGKNENQEIRKLWEEFLPRQGEIAKPGRAGAFGVCRCIPGATDGSFEYVAAFEARPDAPLPEGMIEVAIPEGEYVRHRFVGVENCMQAWQEAAGKLAADAEWTGFCNGPGDCRCAERPCFEYYPPEFDGRGPAWVYIPVHRI